MAEKKNEKEHSVEDRLKALYQLQTLLSEIDRIKILRGELPNEVKDREDEIVRFETRIEKHKIEVEELNRRIRDLNADMADRKTKIANYEEHINNVRNNREFAFLEKEKEYESLEIELDEKNLREAKEAIAQKQAEMEHDTIELDDNRHILEQKKHELEDIVAETRQEEENLMKQAKDLEPMVDDYTLAAFKRIRKNARNGLGIVTVQRGACGGCFNRIPPQRQLEIKMHKKIIVCEYCGRIMIDNLLAGIEPEVVAVPEKKTRRKSAAK
jgi:hypothetical protein